MPIIDVNRTNERDESVVDIQNEDIDKIIEAIETLIREQRKTNMFLEEITGLRINTGDFE